MPKIEISKATRAYLGRIASGTGESIRGALERIASEESRSFDSWGRLDLRRAFVCGGKYWEYEKTGCTMCSSDRGKMEHMAEKRYPGGSTKTVQ